MITEQKCTLRAPFCEEHKDHWRRRNRIALLGFLALVLLLAAAFSIFFFPVGEEVKASVAGFACFGFLVLLLVWFVVYMIMQSRAIGAREITHDTVTLKNVWAEYDQAVDAARNAARERFQSAVPAAGTSERRPCPMCGEMIVATAAKCRFCGEIFNPELKRLEGSTRKDRSSSSALFLVVAFGGAMLIIVVLVAIGNIGKQARQRQFQPAPGQRQRAAQPNADNNDLAAARAKFTTKLTKRGPAPQDWQPTKPPPGVRVVEYQSGDLKLKGWLSADPGDGQRHPAVVFLHGGWSFDLEDWENAAPFAEAGFVLFTPMLRAENGNPGVYEAFYGEVDDAIAAGRYVAGLPFVDPDKVFVAGHSVGAVLTVLAAMMPSPYKSAAALDGFLDMEAWVEDAQDPKLVVFDPDNEEEVRLRNPLEFVPSLRIPLTLYVEPDLHEESNEFVTEAKGLGKQCELVVVPGDHQTMVAPAVTKAIAQFRAAAGK